jgi:VanZ family protein
MRKESEGRGTKISMFVSRQQKLIIILLVFYWPTIFILAHMPIPHLVREADVSDKGVHFLAYLILTFLFWFAINPNKKVNWREAGAWWILLVVVLYGVLDEVLQNFVQGRSCDIRDFYVDLIGTLLGLIILSIFTFWPVCLIVTGANIFGLTNIARVNVAALLPIANIAFHFFAYVFFTLLWIHFLRLRSEPALSLSKGPDLYGFSKLKWLIRALILPIGFLLAVKLGSLILGRSFTLSGIIASVAGIAAAVATIYLITLSRRRLAGGHPPNN